MRRFRDWPIGRKVSLVVMITSTIVLLLTCSAFLTYEWITFRRAALRDLTTLGQIIGDNSTAALRFRSETEAGELLATLKAEETIVYAGLYDSDGRLFASYSRDGTIPPSLNESDLRAGHRFTPRHLFLYQNVMRDDHKLGTLYIQSSLATVQKRFLLYGGMALLILLGSYLVAWILSSRLQQRITGPIHELARTARAISTGRDYSMRASRYGNDELGELTDSFNDMLVQIKERDERISANEERLLVALAAAEMGTWRFYPERQETIVDENLRRLLGLPQARSGSSAENLFMYIFPEDRARVREALNRPLQGGRGYFAEYRIIRPDGAIRWVRDRGKIVLNPDREVAYVTGALVDITDRKEAEQEIHRLNADLELRVAQRTAELAQTNLDLEAFTYSVSHDLRAPLRHMAGYAQILKDDHSVTLSSEAVFYLERIVQGAGRTQPVDRRSAQSRQSRPPVARDANDRAGRTGRFRPARSGDGNPRSSHHLAAPAVARGEMRCRPDHSGVRQSAVQCGEILPPAQRRDHRHRHHGDGRGNRDLRSRQRRRLRPRLQGQALRHLPTLAQFRRVRGQRGRARNRRADRSQSRRTDLGRRPAGSGRDVLFYPAGNVAAGR